MPTDNGVWFPADFAEKGPHDKAVKVTSLADFTTTFGKRVSYSILHDSLEAAFADGLAEAYIAREVGPAPVKASRTLVDRAGVPLNTLRIDALYVGDYANGATGGLSVTVENGTELNTFRLIIEDGGNAVERFDNLASPAAAVAALASSRYVRAVDLASTTAAPNNHPALIADANLTGGTDDRAAASDAQLQAALNLFTKDLGPGQVSAPGRTTAAVHTMLINHARANNRTAYLDVPDKATEATLQGAVDAIENLVGAEYAGMFGNWWDIPGLTAGTTRAVPGSAVAAGLTALADAREGTSGVVPGGEAYGAQFALSVRLPAGGLDDAAYTRLNDNGIIMARNFRHSAPQLYGFRSISKDPEWLELTANRLRVSLTARLESIAQRFVLRNIDSKGHLLGELNGALVGECMEDFRAGALYGDRNDPDNAQTAFLVDTGPTVNTEPLIAAREVRAEVYARFSKFAELVRLEIVKVPITSPLGT